MRRSYFPGVCDSHFSGVSIFWILAWVVLCGYSLGWFYVDTRLGGSLFLVQSRLFCCLDVGAMLMDVVPSQLSKLDTCMSYKLVFSLIYVYSFYL